MHTELNSEPNHASNAPILDLSKHVGEIENNQPGQLQVIKRDGQVSPYDANKITVAISKAFLAVEGEQAADSSRVHEIASELSRQISQALERRLNYGSTVHIEDIQDQVELALMRSEHHKVARAYVLYREERRRLREATSEQAETGKPALQVTLDDGSRRTLDTKWLQGLVHEACLNLDSVEPESIINETLANLYDGVPQKDVVEALIMTARTYVEKDTQYTYVTSRILLEKLRNEALTFLGLQAQASLSDMQSLYAPYFKAYIQKGIEAELLDPELQTYDLDRLSLAIKPERDTQFTYLSLQTLYDRYFLHTQDTRFELPQAFFMRVAMGLAINEKDREKSTLEFYNLLSSFDFMSSTPTLFNSGTLRPQLSSCYLTTVGDDLHGIFGAIRDNAMLSKFAGGLGNDWTPVRALGSHIKGTNGRSLGVVPFLNVADATAVAVNQGGKRKGAVCAYLETWHKDIEEFLELRKNTGDDRRRTHDMNTANWVPDLFMKRVFEGGQWTLFSPDEVPDLHDLYGNEFAVAYEAYEKKAQDGEIENFKVVEAKSLWRKMLSMLFETGHPWITFKDPCNLRSPQQHIGTVHSSNLCTEITLNTSAEEIAVCNLGSINLPAHVNADGLDVAKLQRTIKTAIRMLDNVIDYNYYSVPQAKNSNLKHRPIGMGLMGFQDALFKQNICYGTDAAVDFADRSMEQISYFAIEASSDLAVERGTYQTYKDSLWAQGILPIDSIQKVKTSRGEYFQQDTGSTLDWDSLRKKLKKQGIRNSNVMAIAPTATIANICGVSPSIEPTYQNLYVKSNLSGEFTVINPYLVADLKALDLWDEVMVNDLKYYDGSVQKIERVPAELKAKYKTAFELDPKWLVDAGSRRQKWIDQAQSLNLYVAQPSGKKLDELYKHAWLRGLKTTYYLRSLGATNAEKSTVTDGALNAVQSTPVGSAAPSACSIDDPDCEACQ